MGDKLLIFDFDGTIVDTKALWYNSSYAYLKFFGFKYNDIDRVIDLGFSLRRTLKKLGFNFLSLWILKRQISGKVRSHVNDIRKCKDVDSIRLIPGKRIIVTNSLKEFALPILKHLKLMDEFSEIYGADDFSDKTEFVSSYLKEKRIKKKDCFYIGDRVADVKLAKEVGCNGVVVLGKCAWDSKSQLIKAGPDFVIEDIAELKEILLGS